VAIAVRPNSRSVSVSQGKGLELPQAMASALMEASEGYHAEEIGPLKLAAYRDLVSAETIVEPASLCGGVRPFDPARAIAWIEGVDLLRREPCWLPAEIVHTDYTVQQAEGYFVCGSNGLGSGHHFVQAVKAALSQVVR